MNTNVLKITFTFTCAVSYNTKLNITHRVRQLQENISITDLNELIEFIRVFELGVAVEQ